MKYFCIGFGKRQVDSNTTTSIDLDITDHTFVEKKTTVCFILHLFDNSYMKMLTIASRNRNMDFQRGEVPISYHHGM